MLKAAKERSVHKITLWSDNGSHFHSTTSFLEKRSAQQRHGIEMKLRYFEAGEGKSDLDRHFGCLRRTIGQYLLSGVELNGNIDDLLAAVRETQNTTIYKVTPAREHKTKEYCGYIAGISRYRDVCFGSDGKIVGKMVSGEFKEHDLSTITLRSKGAKKEAVSEEVKGKKGGPRSCRFCGLPQKNNNHSECNQKRV